MDILNQLSLECYGEFFDKLDKSQQSELILFVCRSPEDLTTEEGFGRAVERWALQHLTSIEIPVNQKMRDDVKAILTTIKEYNYDAFVEAVHLLKRMGVCHALVEWDR